MYNAPMRCGYCRRKGALKVSESSREGVCVDCAIRLKVGPYAQREACQAQEALEKEWAREDKRKRRFR